MVITLRQQAWATTNEINLGEEPISHGFSLRRKPNTMSLVRRGSQVFMG